MRSGCEGVATEYLPSAYPHELKLTASYLPQGYKNKFTTPVLRYRRINGTPIDGRIGLPRRVQCGMPEIQRRLYECRVEPGVDRLWCEQNGPQCRSD